MNGNVNSIEYIMSICEAGTVELLRLRTLYYYLNNMHLFCLFAFFFFYDRSFRENYCQPRMWILITRVRLFAVQK